MRRFEIHDHSLSAIGEIQHVNAFEQLEEAAHRGALGGLAKLVGEGGIPLDELASHHMLGQSIDQQAQAAVYPKKWRVS